MPKEKKLPCSLPTCDNPPVWRIKDDQGRLIRNWCQEHYNQLAFGLERRGWTAEAIASPETELALRPKTEPVAPTETPRIDPALAAAQGSQREFSGAMPPQTIPEVPQLAWWQGAGELTLTPQQQEILWQDVNEDEVQIRADGVVYIPWGPVWKILLRAFSPYVPALVPLSKPMVQDRTICHHMIMTVNGKFVGEAVGECRYIPTNRQMSWASCLEGATSDALVKLAKRLGVFQELWSLPWCNAWRKVHAVRVFRTQARGEYVSPWQWRRIDDEPFYDEGDPRKSSPGQGANAMSYDEENDRALNAIARE